MQMQEPRQQQRETRQGYDGDSSEESWRQRSEHAQKIHPREEPVISAKALAIFAIVFSALGFFGTIVGIVASSLILRHVNEVPTAVLVGGGLGLGCSIFAMLMFIGIYVIAIITLTGGRGTHSNHSR